MKRLLFISIFLICCCPDFAQPVLNNVLKANREKLYRNIVSNTINKNLSVQLSDSTEENWQAAFGAMELIQYRSPWIDNRIRNAMEAIQTNTTGFQRAMLELIYTLYPVQYIKEVNALLEQTADTKTYAMCAEYLLNAKINYEQKKELDEKTYLKLQLDPADPFLYELSYQLMPAEDQKMPAGLYAFLEKAYLPGNTLLFSFQRKDRDYPGLVMLRDSSGNFIKGDDGNYFAVPQLARSITNLPGYLTNGNTPEGIFRMDGFDNSKSSFIGPTTNIQLTMPFEFRASHFYQDSTLNDTIWDINMYKQLLPKNFRNYIPLLQSYYAGKAGRTEIIAHGTTIDPAYYKGKTYYPLTPTLGCLCTKEIWSEETGSLVESDQQRLSAAVAKAGGPHGYAIVINIDDKQEPVSMNDILPFLKLASQK